MTAQATLLEGDALAVLRTLPEESVHVVVTSPPYWGLRDYGVEGQLGLEPTPEEYVEKLVAIFREARRVLRKDGAVWLNIGDCYATGAGKVGDHPGGGKQGARWRGEAVRHRNDRRRDPAERSRALRDGTHAGKHDAMAAMGPMTQPNRLPLPGLKPKDLVGIPWRVAFALQADGWWLRSDVIWHKPNPMPSSVQDRPTCAHEYVFLLTKSELYFYDHHAVLEPFTDARQGRDGSTLSSERNVGGRSDGFTKPNGIAPSTNGGRNKRTVWMIATQPYAGAHFAVMPEALVEPCVRAGTSEGGACSACGAPLGRVLAEVPAKAARDGAKPSGKHSAAAPHDAARRVIDNVRAARAAGGDHDNPFPPKRTTGFKPPCDCGAPARPCVVLDPFAGSGTVPMVALRLGREGWGIELNPIYVQLAHDRICGDAPLLNRVTISRPPGEKPDTAQPASDPPEAA